MNAPFLPGVGHLGVVEFRGGEKMDPRIEKMLTAHGDLALLGRVRRAAESYPDLIGLMQRGYHAGLTCGGVFECAHCGEPLLAPWHPDGPYDEDVEKGPDVLLTETEGETIFLCPCCFSRAVDAWIKVREGFQTVTAEEEQLAAYLRADDRVASKVGLCGMARYATGDVSAADVEYLESLGEENSGDGPS